MKASLALIVCFLTAHTTSHGFIATTAQASSKIVITAVAASYPAWLCYQHEGNFNGMLKQVKKDKDFMLDQIIELASKLKSNPSKIHEGSSQVLEGLKKVSTGIKESVDEKIESNKRKQ